MKTRFTSRGYETVLPPDDECKDKITPFRSMPKICDKLSPDDYVKALTHPQGILMGFFSTIHANPAHPGWYNIAYAPLSIDRMVIYTKKGWAECYFVDILKQLLDEAKECFLYIDKNKHDIFPLGDDD